MDRESLLSFMDEIKVMIYLGSHPNLIELVGSDTKGLEKGKYACYRKLDVDNREHHAPFSQKGLLDVLTSAS